MRATLAAAGVAGGAALLASWYRSRRRVAGPWLLRGCTVLASTLGDAAVVLRGRLPCRGRGSAVGAVDGWLSLSLECVRRSTHHLREEEVKIGRESGGGGGVPSAGSQIISIE